MKNVIIKSIAIFFINFILQFFTGYFVDEFNGQILILEPIKENDSTYYQTILISNFKKNSIEGLKFFISEGSILTAKFDETVEGKTSSTKFQINEIYPLSNIVVFLKLSTNSSGNIPTAMSLNHEKFKLALQNSVEIKRPNKINWINIVINSTIISILFGFFIHYLDQSRNKFYDEFEKKEKKLLVKLQEKESEIKKHQEVLNKDQKERNELHENVNTLRNTWTKIRILLLNQIRDLKSENIFYRKIIEIIVQKIDPKLSSKDIENTITKGLGTYSTKANIESELKSIDVIASFFKNEKTP